MKVMECSADQWPQAFFAFGLGLTGLGLPPINQVVKPPGLAALADFPSELSVLSSLIVPRSSD